MLNRGVVVLTGGGTAGHVMPNLAIVPELRERGWKPVYIGSAQGGDRDWVGEWVVFHGIATGKLRRYFAWRNFSDPLKIAWGVIQAFFILGRVRPVVVFSKGGYVGLPVVLAARLRGIPVVLHESDRTPGLANRLAAPLARAICFSFADTAPHPGSDKYRLTGLPIRREILLGSRVKGLRGAGFRSDVPVVVCVGGSQGSEALNDCTRSSLGELLKEFQVFHVCGRGKVQAGLDLPGYRQVEFAGRDWPNFLAMADVMVTRAGANSLFELAALRKPALVVPLGTRASRGDQVENARSFEAMGCCRVVREEDLSPGILVREVKRLYKERQAIYQRRQNELPADGVTAVVDCLEQVVEKEYRKKAGAQGTG